MFFARSLAKNSVASAMSSASVIRLSGERSIMALRIASSLAAHLGLAGDHAVDAVACDGAGRDAVDPDPARAQLERHAVRHSDLARLRRAIADPVGQPAPARPRRDVDDGAAARLDHLRHREAGADVRAGQARMDRVHPVVHRVVLYRLRRPAVARVVDQRGDLAEGLHPRLDHALDVGFLRGVARDGDGAPARLADQVGRLAHEVGGPRRTDDGRFFAREKAAVVCAARSADLVRETADLVGKAGGRAIAVTCDAAKEADVKRMIEAGVKAFGKITTLINNAGDGGPTKPVEDYTMDDWMYTIHSCLTSSYVCTRFAVPEMIKAGGGAIVNISSGAGRRGLPYRIGYCSAKAGQVGMTYGMALELAPHNIRVNCVAPGAVEGDRIDRVIAGQAQVRGISVDQMRKAMIERSPLKRMVTADDIVEATLFFASDMARSVSGQVLAVNAGEPAG